MNDTSMLMVVMDIIPTIIIVFCFASEVFITQVVDVSEEFEIPEIDVSDVPEVFDVPDVFDVPEVYPEMLMRFYTYVMLSI